MWVPLNVPTLKEKCPLWVSRYLQGEEFTTDSQIIRQKHRQTSTQAGRQACRKTDRQR